MKLLHSIGAKSCARSTIPAARVLNGEAEMNVVRYGRKRLTMQRWLVPRRGGLIVGLRVSLDRLPVQRLDLLQGLLEGLLEDHLIIQRHGRPLRVHPMVAGLKNAVLVRLNQDSAVILTPNVLTNAVLYVLRMEIDPKSAVQGLRTQRSAATIILFAKIKGA